MRPIETEYRSVTFKSRMEAKWAMFFDSVGIEWKYEQARYLVPGVGRYTPDFSLRSGVKSALAEVKPEWPTGYEVHKCRSAAGQSGLAVAVLIGVPAFAHYWTVTADNEKLVYVWMDGEMLVPAPMDTAASEEEFGLLYHDAVIKVSNARFDGWDDDRERIGRRYK